jgi:transcriptional regulator with XRE-family HTH domain
VRVVNLAERLAETLRKVRADAGLSQVQMAKRLGVGRSTLNRLEAADQNVTVRTLDQLCRALRCDVGELFGGTTRKRANGAERRRSAG